MTRQIATLLNNLFSEGLPRICAWGWVLAWLTAAVFTLAGATGRNDEGLLRWTLVAIFVLLACSYPILTFMRWSIVVWVLRNNIDSLVKLEPSLIVGIGPGGAIVAGMIAKLLAERIRKEPQVVVFNRQFSWTKNCLDVQLLEQTTMPAECGSVLLATSEVHSGNVMKLASQRLDELGITHSTFALICAPEASITVNHVVIHSPHRGLLPWQDSPDRQGGSNS